MAGRWALGNEKRSDGFRIDLERLEDQARELYLYRFVEAVKEARGVHGKYLHLRAGDKLAIQAADDGSAQTLDEVTVDPDS
jgi:hypothetical protein